MSIKGQDIAIIGLGMSCQTSWQIRHALPLLRELTGDETLQAIGLPFDWLTGPLTSIARMMDADAFFPAREEVEMRPRPFWMDTTFFHAFTPDHGITYDVDALYEQSRGRAAHCANTLRSLRTVPRIVAFISNTQNNLVQFAGEPRPFSRTVTAEDVSDLKRSAEAYLEKPVEFVVVTHAGAWEPEVARLAAVHEIAPDGSQWMGAPEEWATVLRSHFGADRVGRQVEAAGAVPGL